jgi:hypothetical protein
MWSSLNSYQWKRVTCIGIKEGVRYYGRAQDDLVWDSMERRKGVEDMIINLLVSF